MSGFKMKSTAGSVEAPEKGSHLGRVIGLVNLDHQPGFSWSKGGRSGTVEAQYKMSFVYELPTSLNKDGKPFIVDEDFKISGHEKSTMYKRVTTLDPAGTITNKGDDLTQLINIPCMIEIDINDGGYPKIKNVSGIPSSMAVQEASSTPFLFDFDEPDYDIYCGLRKLTRSKLKASLNFEGSPLHSMLTTKGDPDAEDDAAQSTAGGY